MPEYEELGTQYDGEPAVVAPTEPAPEPEPTPAENPEAAGGVEPAPEGEPEAQESERKKKTGSQREKERRLRLEQENQMLRDMLLRQQPPAQAAPQVEDPSKPRPEQFESHDSYVEALTEWKVETRLSREKQAEQAAKQSESWETRLDAAREKYEDFDDALASAPPPSPAVAKVILAIPEGADLAYELANDPKALRRLNSLPPELAALELAERVQVIRSKNKAVETPKPKQPSKAPAPAVPAPSSASVPAPVIGARFEEF